VARFLHLRNLIVNVETIAVVRPINPDVVMVVTTAGHNGYVDGEDAVDLLAYLIDEATNPFPSHYAMELARAWLQETSPVSAGETEEDADDE
jgi:hypothetical protein